MKKKILLFAVVTAFAIGVGGCCSKNDDAAEPQNAVETQVDNVDSGDGMVNHIKSLTPEDRTEFLNFWQASIVYCNGVALELKGIKNTAKYEFDPTDEAQIPAEISKIYNFSRLSQANSKKLHKDFKMTIDGTDVTLSFDGMDIYPTTYGYSDIQEIINSLN